MKRFEVFLIVLLLILLIAPRILVYVNQGTGILTTDARDRYIPQAEKQLESFKNFFAQTGPAYSFLLLYFKLVNNDMVTGPVLIQHVLGIFSAFLIYIYLRRISILLAFTTVFLVFTNELSVGVEHYLLRDSLASSLLIILMFLMFYRVEKNIKSPISKGTTAGILAIVLCLVRVEFVVLIVLLPFLLLFCIKKYTGTYSKAIIVKYIGFYFLPFLIFGAILYSGHNKVKFQQYSGAYFNIAYHSLDPSVFRYNNSKYPELLSQYRQIMNKEGSVTNSMGYFYTATQKYLVEHPEIHMNFLKLMDCIFIEMVVNNPVNYLKSYSKNLTSMTLANGQQSQTLVKKTDVTKFKMVDILIKIFTYPAYNLRLELVSKFIVFSFLICLPVLFLQIKKLPIQIMVSLFVVVVQLLVLSAVADPVFRFAYPITPFYFAVTIYLISVAIQYIKTALEQTSKAFRARLE